MWACWIEKYVIIAIQVQAVPWILLTWLKTQNNQSSNCSTNLKINKGLTFLQAFSYYKLTLTRLFYTLQMLKCILSPCQKWSFMCI